MKPNEVCVEIQLLSKHGLRLRRIAAEVGCAVNTVRRHLALMSVPKYERKVKRPSKLAPYEAYLRKRQAAAQPNWIPASVLHREIAERGCQGGLSQLRAFMRSLRPTLPVEPEVRSETAMGVQVRQSGNHRSRVLFERISSVVSYNALLNELQISEVVVFPTLKTMLCVFQRLCRPLSHP